MFTSLIADSGFSGIGIGIADSGWLGICTGPFRVLKNWRYTGILIKLQVMRGGNRTRGSRGKAGPVATENKQSIIVNQSPSFELDPRGILYIFL